MLAGPDPTRATDTYGPYELYERLGLGGMATVHRAKKHTPAKPHSPHGAITRQRPAPRPRKALPRKSRNPTTTPGCLRETAKATVRWVKGVIPWLDDGEAAEAGKEVVLNHSDWSGSPAGHARGNDASRLPSAHQAAQPEDEVVYGEVQRKQLSGAEGNVIREILELLRLVLEHPMTWLVVSLVVAGGIDRQAHRPPADEVAPARGRSDQKTSRC